MFSVTKREFRFSIKASRFYSSIAEELSSKLKLSNPGLLRNQGYINGEWVSNDKTFEVINPSTGKPFIQVADLGVSEVELAIQKASSAFNTFKTTTPRERSNILYKMYQLMSDNANDLAKIITIENGKPLADSLGEVKYAASFFQWFAEEAPRIYSDIIASAQPNKKIFTLKQPVGVVGILTPWNFPSSMITRKLGAAIAAGCTSIVKPASDTPLSALALGYIAQEAGLPKGVFNLTPVSSEKTKIIGKLFCEHPSIRKVSFTGSTNVGKILMSQSSSSLKRLSFELGGNAPFIVFNDADIDKAVQETISCKFRQSGQTCVCANRIYVHEDVYDEYTQKLVSKVKSLKLGDGFEEGITHGPLIHANALKKVKNQIQDAKSKNAKVLAGGVSVPELGPFFHSLTVLGDVTQDMLIAKEETFGPIAPLIKFKTEQEVLSYANDTDLGLAGYFFSKDYSRILRVAEALNVGMIGANTGVISEAAMPFGGVGYSGFGREGSKYGVNEYLNIKTVVVSH